MGQIVQLPKARWRRSGHTRLRAVVVVPIRESAGRARTRRPCLPADRTGWAVFSLDGSSSGSSRPIYEARGSAPFPSPEKELAVFLRNLDLPVILDLHTGATARCRTLMELAVELGSVIARDCARRDPAGPPDPHPLTALCTALMIAAARPAQRLGLAAEIADMMEAGAAPPERAADRTK